MLDRPPTVSLTAPHAGETISGPVEVRAVAHDDLGLEQVAFEVNGEAQGLFDGDGVFAWTPPFVAGPYTLRAVATDSVGQETATPDLHVTVDWPLQVALLACAPAGGNCLPADEGVEVFGPTAWQVDPPRAGSARNPRKKASGGRESAKVASRLDR